MIESGTRSPQGDGHVELGWHLPVFSTCFTCPDPATSLLRTARRLMGLRYQGVFKFLPARALPACCSRTSQLNRITRVSASAERKCRLISSSRRTLPGKPEGFSRSHTKRLPLWGLLSSHLLEEWGARKVFYGSCLLARATL